MWITLFINEGEFRHVANTIFYASDGWLDWGGQTILFKEWLKAS